MKSSCASGGINVLHPRRERTTLAPARWAVHTSESRVGDVIFSAPDPATDPYFAVALLRLQRSSYALDAELLGDDRIPPLQEDEVRLTAWRGNWRTAWDGVDLVGAIAWW